MNSVSYIRGDIILWVLDGASSWVSVLHNRSPCQAEMEGERKKKEKAGNEKGRKFFFPGTQKRLYSVLRSLSPNQNGKSSRPRTKITEIYLSLNRNHIQNFLFEEDLANSLAKLLPVSSISQSHSKLWLKSTNHIQSCSLKQIFHFFHNLAVLLNS